MNETAQPAVDPRAEPPEVHERNLWLAVRILAGATIMFFLAFVFAYFYLRSLNTHGMWRPGNVDPPQGYGAAIVILFAASAALLTYAADAARRERGWLAAAGLSLVLGLAGALPESVQDGRGQILGWDPVSS